MSPASRPRRLSGNRPAPESGRPAQRRSRKRRLEPGPATFPACSSSAPSRRCSAGTWSGHRGYSSSPSASGGADTAGNGVAAARRPVSKLSPTEVDPSGINRSGFLPSALLNQVRKTTLVQQVAETLDIPVQLASAEEPSCWWAETVYQWRSFSRTTHHALGAMGEPAL